MATSKDVLCAMSLVTKGRLSLQPKLQFKHLWQVNIRHFVFSLSPFLIIPWLFTKVSFEIKSKVKTALNEAIQPAFHSSKLMFWHLLTYLSPPQGRSQWEGWGAPPPPQQTICRKILLSCRNFCVLNNWFWRILRRNNGEKHEFFSVKT